jgi:hypothetical protein
MATGSKRWWATRDITATSRSSTDTANIESLFGGFFYAVPLDTLMVAIVGSVGTATLTETAAFYGIPIAVPDDIDTDDEIPDSPFVLLGRLDNPPALDGFTGIGLVASNALAGYDLQTSIGPIVGGGGIDSNLPCRQPGSDPCWATSRGLLFFTSTISETTGTFTATPQAVPEPASATLIVGGLAAAFVRRSRRGTRR